MTTPVDPDGIADLLEILRSRPEAYEAKEVMLAKLVYGPFTFKIPAIELESTDDMTQLIRRYWMPWQRKVLVWIHVFGLCPYYFEKQGKHPIPLVPDMDSGTLSVGLNKKQQVEYKWTWTSGNGPSKMLWIITDTAPSSNGTLQSAMASLLAMYKTIKVLRSCLHKVAEQNASVSHVLEYHPGNSSARNDELTTLKAAFSDKVAGVHAARQEAAQANTIRMRTAELMRHSAQIQRNNLAGTMSSRPRLLWTDSTEDVVDRIDSGLGTRMLPLRPDWKYVAPARAQVVADLAQYEATFSIHLAAVFGTSLQRIVPTGSSRVQNMQGADQFEQELVRQKMAFLTDVTQVALVMAYRKEFESLFDAYLAWRLRNAEATDVAQLYYPEMEVVVELMWAPSMTYDQMRRLWLDGLMSKDTIGYHAFQSYSIPQDQLEVTPGPPMDLKQQQQPQPQKKSSSATRKETPGVDP